MTRKERVAATFGAAAETYDAAAEAQIQAGDLLAEVLLARPLPSPPRVLEIGCGTGLLTRRLLPLVGGAWLVTDLSPRMVMAAKAAVGGTARFQVMDGEQPDVAGPFDLIVSNLAAQWFADAPAAVNRLGRLLAPGGRLVFTTLAAGSFAEWRAAHRAAGQACGTPSWPTAEEWRARLPAAEILAQPVPVRYADGKAFLRALKAVGASTPAPGHRPLSPGALRRVLAALGTPATVTYEVLAVTLEA